MNEGESSSSFVDRDRVLRIVTADCATLPSRELCRTTLYFEHRLTLAPQSSPITGASGLNRDSPTGLRFSPHRDTQLFLSDKEPIKVFTGHLSRPFLSLLISNELFNERRNLWKERERKRRKMKMDPSTCTISSIVFGTRGIFSLHAIGLRILRSPSRIFRVSLKSRIIGFLFRRGGGVYSFPSLEISFAQQPFVYRSVFPAAKLTAIR